MAILPNINTSKNCNQLHSRNSWSLLLETYFHVNRFYFVKIQIFKMTMSPGVKERLEVVYEIAKTTFHWGFVPMVLYLGKQSWNKHFLAPHVYVMYSWIREWKCDINFIPVFNFPGFKKGAEAGMPPLSIMSLLWQ